MHIEILTEDQSTKLLLEIIVPKINKGVEDKTWRVISYRGIGRIPTNLKGRSDPSKRILLDQLPRVIRGYSKTPGIDLVLVVVDTDKRPCAEFLEELYTLIARLDVQSNVKFRLAIEETEAWYFGDPAAVKKAYPRVKHEVLAAYDQDSICDTWERLADAVYPGGHAAVAKAGWPLPGVLKKEWSQKIGQHMDVNKNSSPSFKKLKDFFDKLNTDSNNSPT